MALARITNYVDGNLLTGAQLNNEFDNILVNGPALVGSALPTLSRVQGLTGSLISNIGSFAANGYQMRTTSVTASLSATSSFSVNTQTAGPVANGRDQAVAFASTTVHFYAITTGLNSTVAAGIVSSNPPPTGPTLPSGYSAWAYLASAIYTVATSVMTRDQDQVGSRVFFTPNILVQSITFSTAETVVDFGASIPAIATKNHTAVIYRANSSAAGTLINGTYYVGTSPALASTQNKFLISVTQTVPATGILIGTVPIDLPNFNTTAAMYWLGAPATTGQAFAVGVYLNGFTVPNGDA